MYIYPCVCVCVSMYVHIRVCVCMCQCVYRYIYPCVCVSMCVYVCVCVNVCTCISMCVCVPVYQRVCALIFSFLPDLNVINHTLKSTRSAHISYTFSVSPWPSLGPSVFVHHPLFMAPGLSLFFFHLISCIFSRIFSNTLSVPKMQKCAEHYGKSLSQLQSN